MAEGADSVDVKPYKVLDLPGIQEDFYLNLIDWSSQNILAAGLDKSVIKLCELATAQDSVTSVQWSDKGDFIAVGTNSGITQVWDVQVPKKVHELPGDASRINCLAWNGDIVCSGSQLGSIMLRDVRESKARELTHFSGHTDEICGLKWSPDKEYLASGCNDSKLMVWNLRRPEPFQTYTKHTASVKALAWSPHNHGLLVSGGGTTDRSLRFWNTLTGEPMQRINTGSQVCNVAWSKHSSELVSTHGFSGNEIVTWKYPSMEPVMKWTGHLNRVLYFAMSPDGKSIVTGAGDETLRFWHVFNKTV